MGVTSAMLTPYSGAMLRNASLIALLSAALFGASTPAAKALLGTIDPVVLAGLLYCGVGVGVAALRRIGRPLASSVSDTTASLPTATGAPS